MFQLPADVSVYLHHATVAFRLGANSLAVTVSAFHSKYDGSFPWQCRMSEERPAVCLLAGTGATAAFQQ